MLDHAAWIFALLLDWIAKGFVIHWINPLAWYGLGRIIVEQEIACDNLVLGTGTKASDYARNLLALSDMRRGRIPLCDSNTARSRISAGASPGCVESRSDQFLGRDMDHASARFTSSPIHVAAMTRVFRS